MPFEIGDAVTCTNTHPARTGHISRIRHTQGKELYDVTFEHETAHALLEDELSCASVQEVRAMLAGLALAAEAIVAGSQEPSPAAYRDLLLIQEDAKRFEESQRRLTSRAHVPAQAANARFARGETVAVCGRNMWSLGTICAITWDVDGAHYDLEVEGELERHDERELKGLSELSLPLPPHVSLGQRARMASAAHSSDPEFTGTVCRIERTKDGFELALAFDDGDVFLGLAPEDLVACTP